MKTILLIASIMFSAACGGSKPTTQASAPSSAAATCQPVTCELACTHGFKKDPNGCDVCECAPDPAAAACTPVTCELFCENGFATDERGCEKCACK